MSFTLEEIFEFGKDLGIVSNAYQENATRVYKAFDFLMQKKDCEETATQEAHNRNRISFRVQKNPPALQVRKLSPQQTKQNQIAFSKIEILSEESLNREIILLTPDDITLVQLHFHNMLPEDLWEFSQNIKSKHPDIWIALQRFTFEDEKAVLPFSFQTIKASDEKTWDYLSTLPLEIAC